MVIQPSNKREYYPNMDIMRYILAAAVMIAHTNELANFQIPFIVSSFEAVGGFFALSGFLMYANYCRHNSFRKYTAQRARRILPPYMFIVVFAAIALVGVSSLSVCSYYTSPDFWKYLAANITFLNWLHPSLPGVFDTDIFKLSAVNASLWTMKVEWLLYFSVPIFIWILSKIKKLRSLILSIIIVICSIIYVGILNGMYESSGREIYNILSRQIFGQLSYFYCGMIIYFIRDFFKKYLSLSIVVGFALLWASHINTALNIICSPLAISIIVLGFSLIPADIKFLRHRNNVSYEMYLFHFPIVQLSIYWGINQGTATVEFLYVFVTTILLSIIVHWSIEKWRSIRKAKSISA